MLRNRLVVLLALLVAACVSTRYVPTIPRTWEDQALHSSELPLFDASHSPRHISAERYYKLPVRPIYRSYPVYHPDQQPEGYREWLASREPEIVFDPEQLHSEQDWIEAGALVYQQPIEFEGPVVSSEKVLDRAWYERFAVPVTNDGVMPFARWVVTERGQVKLGNLACAMCHSRVLDDGTLVAGAQGNFPFDALTGADFQMMPPPVAHYVAGVLTHAPWAARHGAVDVSQLSPAQIGSAFAAVPAGVIIRQGVGLHAPVRVPDLIGVAERTYLDATGFVRHRSIADLMRYAALNQGMDVLADYGGFVPVSNDKLGFAGANARYSDAQLYALARFLYALTPPPCPNPTTELTQRGEQIFADEGCGKCHTPPLYTNNRLVRALPWEVPAEHPASADISSRMVDTDPELAIATRRGTGLYKVPSLKGLWYRGPLGHSGSVATLEDWFDARRHDPDYTPTGFPGRSGGAVPGHPFGLELDREERLALIAFLRTL